MSLLLIILAVVVVFAIFRIFSARRQAPVGSYGRPAMARSGYDQQELGAEARPGTDSYAGSVSQRTSSTGSNHGGPGGLGGFGSSSQSPGFNTDILPSVAPAIPQAEIDQFLQVAREQFMKLQAIWDAADIHALADFCTPTMTRELSHQIAARKGESNQTEVVSLNVEWLGMSDDTDDFGKPVDEARIRFSGLIREEAGAAPVDFDEAWTLHRVKSGDTGWQLAGITQLGE
jgi:predicted lipid-binding transport protein (Tim44 family)